MTDNNHVYDMIIIGGGPAGYIAALYAARAGFDTLVLERLLAGGKMALTHQIDNYPGFEEGVDGFTLADKMKKQAEHFGAKSKTAEVVHLDLTAEPKQIETASRIADKVILVHRRDTLRATKIYHEPLMQANNVEFRWNSTVKELLHEAKITGVRLTDVNTGEESTVACNGVFFSVGRKPATEFLGGQVTLDTNGYVVAGEDTKTNIPVVYAVGDMRTKEHRQIVTAVADGAVAVHEAEKYLAGGASK